MLTITTITLTFFSFINFKYFKKRKFIIVPYFIYLVANYILLFLEKEIDSAVIDKLIISQIAVSSVLLIYFCFDLFCPKKKHR